MKPNRTRHLKQHVENQRNKSVLNSKSFWEVLVRAPATKWKGGKRLRLSLLDYFAADLSFLSKTFFHLESVHMYKLILTFSFSSTEAHSHLWSPFLPKASLSSFEVALS